MSTAPLPFVSVIIPTRNEEGFISECLHGLLEGTYPLDRMEVLVIDGCSDDRTREIVAGYCGRFANVRLVENIARVVPHAMNIGIREARGEIIVRMDAHARYQENYVMQLVTWMERLRADNVGGSWVTRAASDTPQAQAVSLILSHPFGIGGAQYRLDTATEPVEVDTVPYGCYRRELFDRIGLYDEMFIRNQDDELNARVKQAGGKIFLVPEIRIEYIARGSLNKMAIMLFQYGYFKPLVAIKLGRPATLRQFAPPAFAAAVIGSPLLFWIWSFAPWLSALALLAHCSANAAVSGQLAKRHGWRLFPFIFAGFLIAHLSYGTGYLKGIFDFGLLRRHKAMNRRHIPLSR